MAYYYLAVWKQFLDRLNEHTYQAALIHAAAFGGKGANETHVAVRLNFFTKSRNYVIDIRRKNAFPFSAILVEQIEQRCFFSDFCRRIAVY